MTEHAILLTILGGFGAWSLYVLARSAARWLGSTLATWWFGRQPGGRK